MTQQKPKAELFRDLEALWLMLHTETQIAYYLAHLDIIDETVARGYEDQPLHRAGFETAIASLKRRKDRLARRQGELRISFTSHIKRL